MRIDHFNAHIKICDGGTEASRDMDRWTEQLPTIMISLPTEEDDVAGPSGAIENEAVIDDSLSGVSEEDDVYSAIEELKTHGGGERWLTDTTATANIGIERYQKEEISNLMPNCTKRRTLRHVLETQTSPSCCSRTTKGNTKKTDCETVRDTDDSDAESDAGDNSNTQNMHEMLSNGPLQYLVTLKNKEQLFEMLFVCLGERLTDPNVQKWLYKSLGIR